MRASSGGRARRGRCAHRRAGAEERRDRGEQLVLVGAAEVALDQDHHLRRLAGGGDRALVPQREERVVEPRPHSQPACPLRVARLDEVELAQQRGHPRSAVIGLRKEALPRREGRDAEAAPQLARGDEHAEVAAPHGVQVAAAEEVDRPRRAQQRQPRVDARRAQLAHDRTDARLIGIRRRIGPVVGELPEGVGEPDARVDAVEQVRGAPRLDAVEPHLDSGMRARQPVQPRAGDQLVAQIRTPAALTRYTGLQTTTTRIRILRIAPRSVAAVLVGTA
ncbi:MAG: hypothetical protein R2723_02685 [Microbacterium sp.]